MLHPPFAVFPTLSSSVITLREVAESEADSIKEILHYQGKSVATEEDAKALLRKVHTDYLEGNGINWGISPAGSTQLLGTIGFYRGFKNNTGEVGFILLPQYRGKGIISAALSVLIPFAFDTMKMETIQAYCRMDNEPSRKVLVRAGFKLTTIEEGQHACYELKKDPAQIREESRT